MEVSSWLLFLMVIVELGRRRDWSTWPWEVRTYLGLLGMLLGVLAIGLWISPAVGEKFPGPQVNLGNARWILLAACYPLAFRWWVNFYKDRKWVTWFSMLIVGVSLYTAWQFLTGIELIRSKEILLPFGPFWRATGLFNMPLTWAALVGMSVCLLLGHALLVNKVWREQIGINQKIFDDFDMKWILAAVALGGFALIATISRGAWLAFAAAAIVVFSRVLSRKGTVFLVLSLIVIFFFMSLIPGVGDRIVALMDFQSDTYRERGELWRANWEMLKDHPFFGVGYGRNYMHLENYFSRLGIVNGFVSHAHSNYFQWLGGTGILGTGLFLTISGWLVARAWKLVKWGSDNWIKALALGALGAQLQLHFGGITEANFFDGEVNHMLIFVWGLVVAMPFSSKRPSHS